MARRSAPPSSRCVAKECRRACGETPPWRPSLRVQTRRRRRTSDVERRLPAEGFCLGERYSLCDAYLSVFMLWARRFEMPTGDLTRYSRLVAAVLERPAVRRALEQEGFGQIYAS